MPFLRRIPSCWSEPASWSVLHHPLPSLYRTIKTEDYLILEGTCVKREKSPLTRNQQVLSVLTDGKEYRFSLEKNTRLLAGHSYRL